jgi:hypothetical protein
VSIKKKGGEKNLSSLQDLYYPGKIFFMSKAAVGVTYHKAIIGVIFKECKGVREIV